MKDELRATTWDEFVGQDHLKQHLTVRIAAAKQEDRPVDHILLVGPPGFGKTTLANLIAQERGVPLASYTMPLTLRAMITAVRLAEGVVLLDEVHRAATKDQESLLTVLESGYILDKRGYEYYPLEDAGFTIVAATTEPHKVIKPLYDRFPIRPDFDPYSDDEMAKIVRNMARKADVEITEEDARILGRATGGIPRGARQFVLAARDLQALNRPSDASEILTLCRVTEEGLNQDHLKYLAILSQNGGSAGLRTLQTHLQLNESVVRDLERLLVRLDLITFTEQGRELTQRGHKVANRKTNGRAAVAGAQGQGVPGPC